MKLKIIGFALLAFYSTSTAAPSSGGVLEGDNSGQVGLAQQMQIYEQQSQQEQSQQAVIQAQREVLQRIYSNDSWRVINGQTNFAGGKGWAEIQGIVLETNTDGVILNGAWGKILSIKVENLGKSSEYGSILDFTGGNHFLKKFEVKNIPSRCFNYGAFLSLGSNPFVDNFARTDYLAVSEKMAFYIGMHTNISPAGEKEIIPVFDYGTPCQKIWSPAELAAVKEKQAEPKRQAEAKALKQNQDLADKGDPYGLYRMGQRYRDGEGVQKDIAKAKSYFLKASDAGETSAAKHCLDCHRDFDFQIKTLPNLDSAPNQFAWQRPSLFLRFTFHHQRPALLPCPIVAINGDNVDTIKRGSHASAARFGDFPAKFLAQSLHKSRRQFLVCTHFAHARLLAQNLHNKSCRALPMETQLALTVLGFVC